MVNDIVFMKSRDGLVVRFVGDGQIPVCEWTSHASALSGNRLGAFIRLRDDGGATEQDDGHSLLVFWKSVAGLTSDELRYVGLPDVAPFALEVAANGAIHDADFEIRCGFIQDGRRILGAQREGAWLSVAGNDFVLLDPLYSIVVAIDQFRRDGDADLESRMLWWGRIVEMLPRDAVVDDHLRTLRIAVASSFELDPFVNDNGEPDFDPVVGRRETGVSETGDEEQVFTRVLPAARQKAFTQQFRGLSQVKHRYSVGGSFYVVLTPEVERALGVVRRALAGTASERRDFLQNVSGCLRGAFDSVDNDQIDVDSVFSDDGLSERVRGVGIWIDKALPWITQAAEPWLPPEEMGLRIGSQIVPLPRDELPGLLDQVKEAVKRGEPTVQVGDVKIPADQPTISAIEELIRRSQSVSPDRNGDKKQPNGPEGSDQVLLVTDNLKTVQFRRERRRRTSGILTAAPALQTDLLSHQQEGLAWLKLHWEAGSWGALLADDMGLGKTLEALAFLSCLKTHVAAKNLQHRPMLVVAPTGLLRNWRDEHDKHLSGAGLGRVVEAHGSALRRLRISRQPQAGPGGELAFGQPLLNETTLKTADWVLTTYETLRDYQHSFGRIRWRVGVFDESQKIKNPGARVTDAVLAMNIDFALLMTGTPVENRTADIWSMLDRAEPGMFGTLKAFSRGYERRGADGDSALAELHGRLKQPEDETTPALMLRRLKEDHLPTLPDKQVHRCIVEMPPLQAKAYEEIVLRGGQGGNMLQTLHRLRSISLHSYSAPDVDPNEYIQGSARLSETFRILDAISGRGEKMLLFIEAREMQDFLIGALRRRYRLSEDVLVINGMVSGWTRKSRVDTFQNRPGFDVMILSPRAGGVGLTLTAANHVIHLSRWWNPAVEDQCTDRVFRIGQRRTVHVYLPIARHPRFGDHSFDLKLDSLMERKRDRNRRVLGPTAATREDVSELYRSTMTEAREEQRCGINVDLLEPTAFEEWVLRQLAEAGYHTWRTSRSGDRGADGLALSGAEDEKHTIIVQCKHLQPDDKCGQSAVKEVVSSIPFYGTKIQGEPRPMVVTTAAGFTTDAERLARRSGVRLVDRHNLWQLRTWNASHP